MSRRNFIKSNTLALAGLTFDPSLNFLLNHTRNRPDKAFMVGIQIGAPSLVDEGVDQCLANLQELACVNTLFTMVFSYKEGLSGRTWPPVDHGSQKQMDFRGGYYTSINPKYWRKSIFRDHPEVVQAPDHGKFDVLSDVVPTARKRGMKTIAWLADQIPGDIPEFDAMKEVDLKGRKLPQVCLNNSHFRSFLLAMLDDCVSSNPIDGILWRSERWGALTNTLYKWKGVGETSIPCFCTFCLEKGVQAGINIKKLTEGYHELVDFVTAIRQGLIPETGAYIAFWRILLHYPEVLQWEMFWYDSLREIYKMVYERAKSIRSDLLVGTAIPHSISFNPFYRAAMDLRELAKYNDFLKIIAYHTDGGQRCCNYVDSLFNTFLADFSQSQRLDFLYQIMGFKDGSYDEIKDLGLDTKYVQSETEAWLKLTAGTDLQIWPGIDVDVSPDEDEPKRSREGVRDAVLAAVRAGSKGVILARMYSEMTLDHLAGAGDAIRQLGLGN